MRCATAARWPRVARLEQMLLLFVIFIFVLLHVQFFVRNIFFGVDESTFFTFTVRYIFERDIAIASLWFSIICTAAFALGYWAAYGKRQPVKLGDAFAAHKRSPTPLGALAAAGMLQVVAGLYVVVTSRFQYQAIAETLESSGFMFELRVLYLVLLSHLMLNVPLADILQLRRYRSVLYVLGGYIVSTLLLQQRSRLFEVAAITLFTQLMWAGDKVKLKYFAVVGLALLAPNVIVLGRLGWPENFSALVDGLFSFEYTILFNNLLSAAIDAGPQTAGGFTFTPSLGLMLPSPIRALFGIDVQKSEYYGDLADIAQIKNGGFSLLAEMFTNFGWASPLVLLGLGLMIGRFNRSVSRVGRVSVMAAAAPLFYTAFILAFRNDFGVFLKYVLQLLVVAAILHASIGAPVRRKAVHAKA